MNNDKPYEFDNDSLFDLLVANFAYSKAIALQINKIKSIVENKDLKEIDLQFDSLLNAAHQEALEIFQRKQQRQ